VTARHANQSTQAKMICTEHFGLVQISLHFRHSPSDPQLGQ